MNQQDKQLLTLLKALADESRVSLLRLLHQEEWTVGDLAKQVNLGEPTVSHHLARLREAGLVTLRAAGNQRFYRVNPAGLERFKRLAAQIEQTPPQPQAVISDDRWIDELDLPEEERKILRKYTQNGKLTHLPSGQKNTGIVLQWLSTLFQPDVSYTEKEVNELLKSVYEDDFVSLRRDLIDFGYLRRERGGTKYWLAPAEDGPSVQGYKGEE